MSHHSRQATASTSSSLHASISIETDARIPMPQQCSLIMACPTDVGGKTLPNAGRRLSALFSARSVPSPIPGRRVPAKLDSTTA